jgi:hypothetical protein
LPFTINDILVIDTHEHIANSYVWAPERMGLLHVLLGNHYLLADILSADPKNAGHSWDEEGITPFSKIRDSGNTLSPEEEREALFYYLDRLPDAVLTSDWKSLWIALHELYDLDDPLPTAENWESLDRKIRDRYQDRESWYGEILDRAGIKLLFWCYGPPELKTKCRGVLPLSDFLNLKRGDVTTPEELTALVTGWMQQEILRFNPIAVKIGSAYQRPLRIDRAQPEDAARALTGMSDADPFSSSVVISDFIHNLAAERAAVHGLPVQVHTGLLAGNRFSRPLTDTYAHHLESFFYRHPDTLFDLFHASYPQWGEAVVLCRRYPNVHLNLCWLPTISESATHSLLETALEAVPVNKILWGGDTHSPEMAYGALYLFRSILDRVLYIKDIPDGPKQEIAECILWKNAARLYGLE